MNIFKNLCVIFLILLLSQEISPVEKANKNREIGLVLSGGGAKGLAHIGVLEVLEKYDIEPDYITGTSMGSIVGGLYAIGYKAEKIKEIVLGLDWDRLLMDEISLKNVSMEEKKTINNYVGSFPIDGYKINLPKGLVAGQNIASLLSSLTISAHHIEQFSNFPIPFKCIATDIETGEKVILDSGQLSRAMRASMSIPSAFTPIEINDHYLVDGGLSRNLPAQELKDMGADLIIGVDVGSPLQNREDLTSLVDIMEQSINMLTQSDSNEQRKLCNILIEPQLYDYSMMSFNKADSIIHKGRIAAEKMGSQLKLLKTKAKVDSIPQTIPMLKIDSLYVTEIKVKGLDKVSKNLVVNKLNMEAPAWITEKKKKQALKRN